MSSSRQKQGNNISVTNENANNSPATSLHSGAPGLMNNLTLSSSFDKLTTTSASGSLNNILKGGGLRNFNLSNDFATLALDDNSSLEDIPVGQVIMNNSLGRNHNGNRGSTRKSASTNGLIFMDDGTSTPSSAAIEDESDSSSKSRTNNILRRGLLVGDGNEISPAQSPGFIICRICEEKLSEDCITEHSKYCVSLRQCVTRLQEYDDMILQNMALTEKALLSLDSEKGRLDPKTENRRIFLTSTRDMFQRVYSFNQTAAISEIREAWQKFLDVVNPFANDLIEEDERLRISITHMLGVKVKTLRRKEFSSKRRKDVSEVIESDTEDGKGAYSKVKIKSNFKIELAPSIHDFEFVKKLSRGAFGRVYLAKKKTTKDYFAIKVINKKHMTNKAQVDRILAERDILAQVDSPFIVKLYYSFQTIENLYMVMEYLNGGDLLSLLESVGKFSEAWAQLYIAELVSAVEHLHSLGIVHRDIKPQNLLIDKRGHLKLADFGLSRKNEESDPHFTNEEELNHELSRSNAIKEEDEEDLSEQQQNEPSPTLKRANSFVGTPEYLAPEVILGSGYDESVDWWGVGVVLYQLLTGKHPFYEKSDEKTFENILLRRIIWPKNISPTAKGLIDGLLTVDASKRLGANGPKLVLAHPFFKNIDWNNLICEEASFVPTVENMEDTRYFKEDDKTWSEDSLPLENDAGELPQIDQVTFVDFAYTNVTQLKAANQAAFEKSSGKDTPGSEVQGIRWLENDSDDIIASTSKKAVTPIGSSPLNTGDASSAANQAAQAKDNSRIEGTKERNCLLAEDNPIVQKIAQALLKNLGFTTECVDNGLKALEYAQKTRYSIIFMDIMMPEMDGLEATRKIRQGNGPNKETVIVAFTAMGSGMQGEASTEFLKHGLNDTLPKPFTKNDLYAIVSKWLKM